MDEELCQKLFAQGVEAGQQRRYAEAAGIFTRLLEVGWPEAGLWLGRSYHGLGDYELAVQIFKNQIRIYPGRGDLWFFLGRSLLSLGFHGKAVTIFLKAREAGFSSVQLWGLLGTAYLKSRRPAQAVECFSQALAFAPGHEGMRVGLLNSLLALAIRQFHLQQFDQSRKHLEALIQQGADGITPRLYLANNLRQLGEHQKALEHYKTAQSFRPEDKVLAVYQADCLLALGRKSEALALLQAQGFDLASVPVAPTAKGTSRIPSLDLPFLLFQQGRYRQAVFYALQGIKNHQENTPDLYVLTARSYYRLGEQEKALAHYRQARKRLPRNEEVFYEELSLLWELGDYSGILAETAGFSKEDRTCSYYRLLAQCELSQNPEGTIPVLLEFLPLAGEDPYLLSALGQENQKAGNLSEALKWTKRALKAHPALKPALLRLLTLAEGEPRAKEKALKAYLEYRPEDSDMGKVYARLLVDQGHYPAAIVHLQKVLAQGSRSEGLLRTLAFCYRQNGEFEKALALYQDLLRINPSQPVYFSNGVYCLQHVGRPLQAKALAAHGLKLFPGRTDLLFFLGIDALASKDFVQAAHLFRKILEMTPQSAQAWAKLGYCTEMQGNKAAAARYYQKAKSLKAPGKKIP